jgi:hypothetical protein
MPRRSLIVVASACVALLPAVHAAEPGGPRPDAELLEFLGSDDHDPDLQDYLAQSEAARAQDVKEARKAGQGRSERT